MNANIIAHGRLHRADAAGEGWRLEKQSTSNPPRNLHDLFISLKQFLKTPLGHPQLPYLFLDVPLLAGSLPALYF
jgi:hypothetical protein